MNPTVVFEKNLKAFNKGVRRIINMGGSSSSKTISILELLLLIAQKRQDKGVLISIGSESLPHLKLGAIRDFNNILKRDKIYNEDNIDLGTHSYHFGKSVIEFFSADVSKASGPRRDILYLNECNNIPYTVVEQLEMRTNETIFYDFNPVVEFWIKDEIMALPESEWTLIKSNYKDNKHLPKSILHEIELKAARDPNFKRIHVDVEYGSYKGLIFPKINIVESFPEDCKWVGYGLDFGYTNDPTALIKAGLSRGQLYYDEKIFLKGLNNSAVNKLMKDADVGEDEVIADSSDPKSIDDLSEYGWDIQGAVKGPDSIINGIDTMKQST